MDETLPIIAAVLVELPWPAASAAPPQAVSANGAATMAARASCFLEKSVEITTSSSYEVGRLNFFEVPQIIKFPKSNYLAKFLTDHSLSNLIEKKQHCIESA
jgi:hypothetical protein